MEDNAMPFSRPDRFLPGTHRALVVLRFLLNTTKETHCFSPNPITLYYLTNYIRSAETGEIFELKSRDMLSKATKLATKLWLPFTSPILPITRSPLLSVSVPP